MYKNKICLVYYVLGCKSKTYNGRKGSIFFQIYKTIKDKIIIMSKNKKPKIHKSSSTLHKLSFNLMYN